ncbi:unnamed protein product [Rotaria magnacalcarata]|uniref:Uncharacterized protein n=1 Tax=Rotaria magnacalcarata TaxID=392030 RepID=A0A8S2S1A7_9BILA|nr:unnamed protein product [Rotaria magnacalcarata]CAF4778467.1 unnamed protein product [Rotaria magnacalcarata]
MPFSLLIHLRIPKRTCPIKFDASPMTTDGRYIFLQDRTHSLDLYILDKNFILSDFLHNKSKDFRTLTSDDAQDALFIATSNTIEEYSLLTFNFSKQHNFDKENIYSLRFSSNANQFGLTIGKCHERKWYFEVENRSMIRRCSVVTPIEYGSCLVSILFNYNQWTIVNNHGDILFQVNNSGQIKAEIVYGGRNSLNAIEKKLFIIRTYGYLEQHEL